MSGPALGDGGIARWIADRELLVVLACAPWLVFPSWFPGLTAVAALALPVLWIARWRARGALTVATPLDWPILGMLIMVPVGMRASPYPELALARATTLVLGAALYYAVVNRPDAWRGRWLLPWLGAGVALLALVGVDWAAFKLPWLAPLYDALPQLIGGLPRTGGEGFHPNEVAGTLAMCIPLAVAAWASRQRSLAPCGRPERAEGCVRKEHSLAPCGRPRRAQGPSLPRLPLLLGAMGLMLAVALLTGSRAGWLALAAGLWIVAGWRYPALLAAGGVAAAGLAVLLTWGGGMAWVLSLPSTHTWQARPEIWGNALRAMGDYAFTGMGLDAFSLVSPQRYVYLIAPRSWDFVHAHNLWLQAGVDLGVLGMASLAGFMGVSVYLAASLRRGDGSQAWWAGGLMGGLGAYVAFGLIDAIVWGAKPSLLVWIMAGLVARRWVDLRPPGEGNHRQSWAVPVALGTLAVAVLALALVRPLRGAVMANVGRVYLNRGQGAKAVAWLQRAGKAWPPSARAQFSLGEAYLAAGREGEALLTWRAAGVDAKRLATQAEVLRRANDLDEAERWAGWALTFDPGLSDAWYVLGLIREAQGRPLDALEAQRKALLRDRYAPPGEGNPHAVDALDVERALGLLLVRQGQPQEAARLFESMLAQEPGDLATRYNLGQARALAGDYAGAREAYLAVWQALAEGGNDVDAVTAARIKAAAAMALTTNANRRDDLDEARRWAAVAQRLEPRHPFPYADLAEVYIRHGLYEEALAQCRAYLYLREDPSGSFAYLEGLSYAGLGQFEMAADRYEKAIARNPSIPAFRYRLAEALAALGEAEKAQEALAAARSLGEDMPVLLTGHYHLLTE